MSPFAVRLFGCTLLLALAAVEMATAQGASGFPERPITVVCRNSSYPDCYYEYALCPKSCPRACDLDCAFCKPVCSGKPPRPRRNRYPPPPAEIPISSPLPPEIPISSPPPPEIPTSSPPPPEIPTSSPPPPEIPTSSPPPPEIPTSSPPPPVIPTSSPPPPVIPTSSPPPPEIPIFSPPFPEIPISSPPPPVIPTSSPPPPVIPISSPPPPVIQTPSPPPPAIPTPSPPPIEEISPKEVYCGNENYTTCYRQRHYCPSSCPDQCEVDCQTCKPVCGCNRPGAICQDPRFIGGDGITFYFHGKKNQDFCVVSDSNLHINAHFIGKRNQNMGRDFTWVQSLGILFDNHQISIAAKKTATWNDALDRLELTFDGESVLIPEIKGTKIRTSPGVSFTRSRATNAVVIEVAGNFKIQARVVPITEKESRIHKYGITDEDCFAHLDMSFKFYSLSEQVDGVLGQTYGSNYVSRAKMGNEMPVLGGDKQFSSSGLFSTDCAASKFNGAGDSMMQVAYGNLDCASGIDGLGVVCKR